MKVWLVYKQEDSDHGVQDIGVEAIFLTQGNGQSFIDRQKDDDFWSYRIEEWNTMD